MGSTKLYTRFYNVIARIPKGRVATYGQIATLAGYPGYARQVGYALNQSPDDWDLPWHRVVNSKGGISLGSNSPYDNIQRMLLEAEGILFSEGGTLSLKKYQWNPQPWE